MNTLMMIISFLKKYKYTIAVFLFFQIIVYFQINPNTIWVRKYLFYFVNASSLLLILHLISKCNKIITIILLIVFSLLITFEAYYGFFFNCTITLGIVTSIMVTNLAEVMDVMKDRILPCILIFGFSFFGIFKSANELKRGNIPVKWSLLLLSFYIGFCYPFYVYKEIRKDENFAGLYKWKPVLTNQRVISERFPLIYGQISAVVAFLHEKSQERKFMLQDRIMPEGMFWKNSEELPEKIFFVLGESQYRKHLSLYGYEVRTTPFLDSLYQASSKMTIYDAVSPCCTTFEAVPLLLSFATPNNRNPLFEHKNIIELANDAGYETVWLSNQITLDSWGSNTSFFTSLSHDVYFTGYDGRTGIIDDFKMIPKLQERYKRDRKQFFLIHLQGSHIGYANKSDEIDKAVIQGDSRINQYDRSIHHTDRVLREIYKIMKNDSSAILYYISDHGENPNMGGHVFWNGGFSQFDVPMFFINQTNIDIDSIVSRYFMYEKNRINTLSSTNILAELMGYSFSDEMIKKIKEESYYILHVNGQPFEWDVEWIMNNNEREK